MTTAHVINGKALADTIITTIASQLSAGFHRSPGLASVLVGENPASKIYIRNKIRAAQRAGISSFHHQLDQNTSEHELLALIDKLNTDEHVDGILVQMPLPPQISAQKIIETIDPQKDVDGFHPMNLGHLMSGVKSSIACTPLGVMHMLKSINCNLSGKHAVVVGRSTIVGKPMAQLLLQKDATVTVCHSKTDPLSHFTRQADIVIAAVGKAKLLNEHHIKKDAIVIDVGINRDEHNKLCGDVDFDVVKNIASYISPVPGGVGPLTIAMLLNNTWDKFAGKFS
ncbi:MAG: bifunctional methylenetetrahydrofolate dehydrogenase/methenyltetrahydrofolate cyclohydrolase FolD [Myxococcales bacterium]|nr:bifunctional methylenetetrahydrofolate dehydrogenase/methenyltetrahydrofolate cyclohydrolase FolD [Myxococcales bacterium]